MTIIHHIKDIEDISLDDKNNTDARNEECDIEIQDCNIASWSKNLLQECRKMVAEHTIKCDIHIMQSIYANPYYVPQLSKKLKTILVYFPLYSSVMIPIFGYEQINASSSAVESEKKDIKHILLKNMSRPMRADKFVTTHLSLFAGRSLLAMSPNESPSINDNEQIVKNSEITITS